MTYEMYTPSSSDKIHKNTINLAHEICVQILKMEVVMDEVMDRVVELNNTICYRVWKLCFLGNRQPSLQVSIHVSGWQSGSHADLRVKDNLVRKIK